MGVPIDWYAPTVRARSACDIPLAWILSEGIKLALLDLDNTMVDWGTEIIDTQRAEHVMRWVETGIIVCLVSNTYEPSRVKRLALGMGGLYWEIPGWHYHHWKPSPYCLYTAMGRFGVSGDRSVMIGDQLSDMLAGKRAGCKHRILVDPTSPKNHLLSGYKLWRQHRRMSELAKRCALPDYFPSMH